MHKSNAHDKGGYGWARGVSPAAPESSISILHAFSYTLNFPPDFCPTGRHPTSSPHTSSMWPWHPFGHRIGIGRPGYRVQKPHCLSTPKRTSKSYASIRFRGVSYRVTRTCWLQKKEMGLQSSRSQRRQSAPPRVPHRENDAWTPV